VQQIVFLGHLVEWLSQHLEHMGAGLWPLIQQDHAVGQRHLARQRHLAAADQPHCRGPGIGGTTRPDHDPCRAVPREAGDAVEGHGVNGFRQGHLGRTVVSRCTGLMARSSCSCESGTYVLAAPPRGPSAAHTRPSIGPGRMADGDFPCRGAVRRFTRAPSMPEPLNPGSGSNMRRQP
jgi:hypothetical protein